MTLREKYSVLNNQQFVKDMIVTSVYNTMLLEGQTVSKEKIETLYTQVTKEKEYKAKALPQVD